MPRNYRACRRPPGCPKHCACHKICASTSSCSDLLRLSREVIAKSKIAHGTTTRAHLRQAPSRGQHFARPCAKKLHMEILEDFSRKLFCEPAQPKRGLREHPDRTRACFTLTVRTPQCGHTVWGTKPSKSSASFYGAQFSAKGNSKM